MEFQKSNWDGGKQETKSGDNVASFRIFLFVSSSYFTETHKNNIGEGNSSSMACTRSQVYFLVQIAPPKHNPI